MLKHSSVCHTSITRGTNHARRDRYSVNCDMCLNKVYWNHVDYTLMGTHRRTVVLTASLEPTKPSQNYLYVAYDKRKCA